MDNLNRDQAKLLRFTYAHFTLDDVDKIIDKIYNIVDKERKEKEDQIAKLEKERDYWKKSFNKQVEASRGGYQPGKQSDGEPLPPPKEE